MRKYKRVAPLALVLRVKTHLPMRSLALLWACQSHRAGPFFPSRATSASMLVATLTKWPAHDRQPKKVLT